MLADSFTRFGSQELWSFGWYNGTRRKSLNLLYIIIIRVYIYGMIGYMYGYGPVFMFFIVICLRTIVPDDVYYVFWLYFALFLGF
jgi:hypothetical protein